MASISALIPQLFDTASGWLSTWNGAIDASPLLLYVINVMTALSGLGVVVASVLAFNFRSGGVYSSGSWGGWGRQNYYRYSGRTPGVRGVGSNTPVFGTKKHPLPYRKKRWPLPWFITGLNVDGRPTYKTKAWKPTNLVMSVLRNGLLKGVVAWGQYKQGVKRENARRAERARGAAVDAETNVMLDNALPRSSREPPEPIPPPDNPPPE